LFYSAKGGLAPNPGLWYNRKKSPMKGEANVSI